MIGSLSDVRQARQPIAAHSVRATFAVVTGGLAVVFGSTMFKTSRFWNNGDGSGQGLWEGAAHWAGWTFLAGVITFVALLIGAWRIAERHRRSGIVSGLLAAGAFAFAAYQANSDWQRLLNERALPRDYTLGIAPGLPIVTVAAAMGTLVTLVLVGFWVGEGVRDRTRQG